MSRQRPLIGVTSDFRHGPSPPEATVRLGDQYVIGTSYFTAIIDAGGLPLLIPCSDDAHVLDAYLQRVDGVLFTGWGCDYPPGLYGEPTDPRTRLPTSPRLECDLTLFKSSLASGKPLLGICAGAQLANVGCGGRLVQHIDTSIRHTSLSQPEDAYHPVSVRAGTLLASILGPGSHTVNSAHRQGITEERVGRGLVAAAAAPDGIVEAVELPRDENPFALFVQWHPERTKDADHRRRLFNAFVHACRTRQEA